MSEVIRLYYAKPVVDISFEKQIVVYVGQPKVVRSFPLKFSGYDWYAAQCGGDLVANGGTPDLPEAHVHDSEDASVEGCLNDEFEVFGMDGLVVVDVVSGGMMVLDHTICDLVHCGASD